MFPYSPSAKDTIQNVIPGIISLMSNFPHQPNVELHSEMTSTRDYLPPLPDMKVTESLSTSPLEDIRIEPGQHFNYTDPCQIITRGKRVPTWEYKYNQYVPVELAGLKSSVAELPSKGITSTFQGLFLNGKK
jgi:hypothetical protein